MRQNYADRLALFVCAGGNLAGFPCGKRNLLGADANGGAYRIGNGFRRIVQVPQREGEFLPGGPVEFRNPRGRDGVAQGIPDLIGVTTLTGIGNVLGDYVITLSHGNLLLALLLTMVVSIFLGMGMPTVAVYIVLATVAAPVLLKMGVPMLAAHFYCFYFGIMANLTPPVAIPAYAAAAIADASPSKTGWAAFKIALPSFLIPYVFVYYPSLMFIDTNIGQLILALLTCVLGVFMIAMGVEGYSFLRQMPKAKSNLLLIGGILMIVPNLIADAVAVVILVYVMVTEIIIHRRNLRSAQQ